MFAEKRPRHDRMTLLQSLLEPSDNTMKSTPTSETELLQRARDIAGMTFGELARQANMIVPENLKRDKGWVGQLLEWHLGAKAGSKPVQDFPEIGVELKSIPISYSGKPLESTFVCVAPLTGVTGLTWETSHIRNKLSRVLWLPVEGEREIPVAERHVGSPLIWSPSEEEETMLKNDWEELMELITLGQVNQITAHSGEVLQIRPKAANSRVKTEAYGASGQPIKTLPRGFYLRASFTGYILKRYFV
ncbi:DNA mismatch repair protein MutH [Vibrio hangzhouensis]|uniref:DNA mismatch repair protein MutH n=2 Tax=Vibrio hangzhouensis TaxID=462991 RepID=A0A1H5UF67_9VIBR|nr:DNA mismatch repair protein MutH [Vibrio hangzhouensis]